MDLGISGKVAMVAAASKGIGLAVATALAKEGCRVSICSRDAAALEAARRKILAEAPGAEVRIFPCDVMSGEDLEAWHRSVAAEMGPVDILVTKTRSNEFARDGVLVNALLPGHVLTDRQIELNEIRSKQEGISIEDYASRVQGTIPIGRYGQPRGDRRGRGLPRERPRQLRDRRDNPGG